MLDLLIVILCLGINAAFSAFEMAFVTIGKEDIEDLDDKLVSIKEKLNIFKTNPERTLSVIQIGITLVGAIAAAVGGTGAVENLEPYLIQRYNLSASFAEAIAVTIVIVPLTYFSVVFGELVPKTIALRYPDKVLAFGTSMIYLIDKFLSPIVSFLEKSTGLILKLLRLEKEEEEELPESVEIGNLPSYHRKFVHNLVGLRSKRVRAVMVPWEKVSFLDFAQSDEEVKESISKRNRSRYPVVDGDVLVGIFHVKEWKELINGMQVPWQSILASGLEISPTDKVLDAFLRMQEGNHHLAVVKDGDSFVGIVTIEDVLEQIVGNIKDDLERNKISTRLLSNRSKISFKK